MFHKIILVGNLGKDPEMRYTPGGQPVTSFSVASNRSYVDSSGQKVDETIWFRVGVWGKQAEICKQYLTKGKQVLVEGRLLCDKQTGGPRTFKRQNGETGTSFEITAEVVRFLGQRGEVGESEKITPNTEEEIPF
jgi:single-strand DNA-binding protein